jgi:RimJ/RimL family protein N-acetyltransferase
MTARPIEADDLNALVAMYQDPRVMATLGGLRNRRQTQENLGRHLNHWRQHGFGIWMFFHREDGQFVGRGGLQHVTVDDRSEVELAYAVRAEFWNQGLATEMAAGSLAVAFEDLQRTDVVAFTLPTNTGSRRVMEKSGFQYEKDITHAELPHVLYRLSQESWLTGRSATGSD